MKKPPKIRRNWNTPRLVKIDGIGGSRFTCSGAQVNGVNAQGFIDLHLNDDFQTVICLWADTMISQEDSRWNREEVTREFNEIFFELLVGQTLERLHTRNGFLFLDFSDGVHLQCPVNLAGFCYEAWQVTDECGFHVVCTIGGELAVWSPTAWQARRAEQRRQKATE